MNKTVVALLISCLGCFAQPYIEYIHGHTNIQWNVETLTLTNDLTVGGSLTFGNSGESIIWSGAVTLSTISNASGIGRLELHTPDLLDVAEISLSFGDFNGEDLHPKIMYNALTDFDYLSFVKIDESAFQGIRIGHVFTSGTLHYTNTPQPFVAFTSATYDSNLVINLTNSQLENFVITNNVTLIATGYVAGAMKAARFIPVNNGTNYTVTVDSNWERYGSNFMSAAITLVSNKNMIMSITSWSNDVANVAAAFKSEQ